MKKLLAATAGLLLAHSALAQESACTAPGILLQEDPTGDAANGAGGTEGTGLPFSDIERLWAAEPRELADRLVFTLKVTELAEPLPPLHRWVVYFTLPDGVEWYAAMSTAEGPSTTYEYGTTAVLDTPAAAVGQFVHVGALDAASTYAADGTITLVLDTAAVGLKAGDSVDLVYVKVRRSTPEATSNMGLTLDDTGAGGFYTLGGNAGCEAGKSAAAKFGSGGSMNALTLAFLGWLGLLTFLRRRAVH